MTKRERILKDALRSMESAAAIAAGRRARRLHLCAGNADVLSVSAEPVPASVAAPAAKAGSLAALEQELENLRQMLSRQRSGLLRLQKKVDSLFEEEPVSVQALNDLGRIYADLRPILPQLKLLHCGA